MCALVTACTASHFTVPATVRFPTSDAIITKAALLTKTRLSIPKLRHSRPYDAIKNGTFETGRLSPWTSCRSSAKVPHGKISRMHPHNGHYDAVVGAFSPVEHVPEPNGLTSICQLVTIPSNGVLTAWTFGVSTDHSKKVFQFGALITKSGDLVKSLYTANDSASKWQKRSFDLSAEAGLTTFIAFGVVGSSKDRGKLIGQFVDDVSLLGTSPSTTPSPTPSPSPTVPPTPTPSPTPTPNIVFNGSPLNIGGLLTCPSPTPANSGCLEPAFNSASNASHGIPDEFHELGGCHPPYSVSSSNPTVASGTAVSNGSYCTLFVSPSLVGAAKLTVLAANGDSAVLPVTVTTLEIPITFKNLPTAYSAGVQANYYTPSSAGVTGTNFLMPSPMPSTYTYTLLNFPATFSWGGGTIETLNVTVSNGLTNVANKTQAVTIILGKANTVPVAVP